jgi:hypothetical protein
MNLRREKCDCDAEERMVMDASCGCAHQSAPSQQHPEV